MNPRATRTIAVPTRSFFLEGSRWAGRSQKLISRVTNGMTAQVKIEEVTRLFINMELGGDQDFMIPKAANTDD